MNHCDRAIFLFPTHRFSVHLASKVDDRREGSLGGVPLRGPSEGALRRVPGRGPNIVESLRAQHFPSFYDLIVALIGLCDRQAAGGSRIIDID